MLPLSCAHERVHTGHETSAHKKTLSAHRCSFQKCFCTYFIHVVQIQLRHGKMLRNRNFMCTQTLKITGKIDYQPMLVMIFNSF